MVGLRATALSSDLRTLADLTLALILFIDAANTDLGVLKRHFRIPSRMLIIGLPGVILFGFGLAVLVFESLSLYAAAILATMLAATDAALGKAVITNKVVPARLREGLNVESGLNDGICVPIVLFFVALAGSGGHGDDSRFRPGPGCPGNRNWHGCRPGSGSAGRGLVALVLETGMGD